MRQEVADMKAKLAALMGNAPSDALLNPLDANLDEQARQVLRSRTSLQSSVYQPSWLHL